MIFCSVVRPRKQRHTAAKIYRRLQDEHSITIIENFRCIAGYELVTELVSRHVVVTCYRVLSDLLPTCKPHFCQTNTLVTYCSNRGYTPTTDFPSWTSASTVLTTPRTSKKNSNLYIPSANPFSRFDLAEIFDSLLPDIILAFAFFTALTYAVVSKRFDRQRMDSVRRLANSNQNRAFRRGQI